MVRRGSVLRGQVASLLHHIVSRKLHPVVVLAVTEEGVQHLHLIPGALKQLESLIILDKGTLSASTPFQHTG